MKEYIVITGRLETISGDINRHLKAGWDLVGGLTAATKGSVIEYAQALTKEVDEKVAEEIKPAPKRRSKKAE